MQFEELLEELKEGFTAFKALIVLDDPALRRYVLCWGPQLVRRHTDYLYGHTMAELWDCVTVDYAVLADLTGHSGPQVMAYFRQAQGLELIYPDGSINSAVIKLLDKKMKQLSGLD